MLYNEYTKCSINFLANGDADIDGDDSDDRMMVIMIVMIVAMTVVVVMVEVRHDLGLVRFGSM